MPNQVRLCLALHNHQPVGNFDHVFEQAFEDSYRPFLEVFDEFPDLRISLHTSGPLLEWLDEHHGEYVDRLAALVAAGRVEIIGGAYYEPILAMIPSRDRVGQISDYTQWLQHRLGANVRGMWMPERVWEQSYTSDVAAAGINYTLLDDFHFRNAGLREDELFGYYITEDQGNLLYIFPGSERLRYSIPFQDPHETIDYLRQIGDSQQDAVVVFGDDGEKFGTWPDTKTHVYDNGWLRRFFQALLDNRDWLLTTTLGEAVDATEPQGKIYLPEGSYREMTEWALPTRQQLEYDDLHHEFADDPRWGHIHQFVRGGFWRNFKVKYPETDEMYTRMLAVSRRLADAQLEGLGGHELEAARRELYRGQCNCSYWHGAFGGAYLPHLRNAVYNHLIAADNLLDRVEGKPPQWVSLNARDYDLDGRAEVRLENEHLVALISPTNGGQLYELDLRSICHNLLATLSRREEAYHRKVLSGPSSQEGVASIHDRVVFKQEGLDQRLHYDRFPRKSLMDHFYPHDVSRDAVAAGTATESGDFVMQPFQARLRRNPDRMQVMLSREGNVNGHPLKITKGVTLEAGSTALEIAYLLENLPHEEVLHFGVEFNFSGLPAGADDRYFFDQHGSRLGQLGTSLDLQDAAALGLADEWLGIRVQLQADRATHFWTFPIETVSQSEGGFELVHQSVVLQPHWFVQGDAEGRWSAKLSLELDSSLAESRSEQSSADVKVVV